MKTDCKTTTGRALLLALPLLCAGCAFTNALFAEDKSAPPKAALAAIPLPGQSLALRLEDGGTATARAGASYVSALGETCLQLHGPGLPAAACLRGGEWTALRDIFPARPGEGARP